jgi:hypothetical protein
MQTSQNTLLLHDDREAQILMQRIKEKKIQEQATREKSLEPNQKEEKQSPSQVEPVSLN